MVQISLEDRAEASFRDINNPKTLVHPFKKNLKIAKVWDVFPDQVLAANKYTILVRIAARNLIARRLASHSPLSNCC